MVPLEMVKKMYGRGVVIDEINHKLSHSVSDYIKENKLAIVGDPMPNDLEGEIDWDTQKEFTFSYDLGLSGDFVVDFTKIKPIDSYEIKAGKKELDETLENLKSQFGEHVHGEAVEDGDMVYGVFTLGDWSEKSAIPMKAIKESEKAIFIGAKIGDVLSFDIQNTFIDQKSLSLATGKKEAEVADLQGDTQFAIEDITRTGVASMNQEFFDKVLGKDKATDEQSFKDQVLTIIESNYKRESEYLLKVDAEKAILEAIDIELPTEFLKKWLQTVGEKKLSPEEAEVEYARSERGLRFQLIEGRAMATNEIKVTFEDLKSFTTKNIRQQMAQFGQTNPTDEEVQGIVARVLSNQDEVKRLSDQVVGEKMLDLFKEKANPTTKEVTYEEFIAASYGE